MSTDTMGWLHLLFYGRERVAEAAEAECCYQEALSNARATLLKDSEKLKRELRMLVEDVERKARDVPSVPPSEGVLAIVELPQPPKKDPSNA